MTAMTAPSLTRGLLDGPGPALGDHLAAHGPLPGVDLHTLVDEAGLLGRGGAGFPTAAKLRSVAAAASATRKAPIVVANGSEGEPASAKDATLLVLAPHLVLDGLALVADSLGAARAYLAVDPAMIPGLAPYLAGEESALCAALDGRPPLSTTKFPPVRERGVDGRPTLVLNVETLARLALIARGNDLAAASMLVTRRSARYGARPGLSLIHI